MAPRFGKNPIYEWLESSPQEAAAVKLEGRDCEPLREGRAIRSAVDLRSLRGRNDGRASLCRLQLAAAAPLIGALCRLRASARELRRLRRVPRASAEL